VQPSGGHIQKIPDMVLKYCAAILKLKAQDINIADVLLIIN
jgi:hypothetical protein